MAVRRPSGVFASLDANARAVLGAGLPQAPTEPTATGPESTPIPAPPPPPATTPAAPKTKALRLAHGCARGARVAGAVGALYPRAEHHHAAGSGSVGAVEPPTAADIDKALEVLQERPDRRPPCVQPRRSPVRRRRRLQRADARRGYRRRAGRRRLRPARRNPRQHGGRGADDRTALGPRHRRSRRRAPAAGGLRTIGCDARRATRDRGRRRGAGRPRGPGGGGGAGAAGAEQAVPGCLARLPHAEPPTERLHQLPRRADRPRGGGRRGGQAAPQGSHLPACAHTDRHRADRSATSRSCARSDRAVYGTLGARRAGGCGRRRRRRRDSAAAGRARSESSPRKGNTRKSRARKGRHGKGHQTTRSRRPPRARRRTKSTPASTVPATRLKPPRRPRRPPRSLRPRSRLPRSRPPKRPRPKSRPASNRRRRRPRRARRPRSRQPPHPRPLRARKS